MTIHESQADLLARSLSEVLRRRGIGVEPGDERGPWLREYEGRELEFCRDILGYRYAPDLPYVALWDAQQACVTSLFESHYVTVRGSRGCGKSETLGGAIIPTFMVTAPSQVLLLGPVVEQARDVVFAKTREAVAGATRPLPGTILQESWRIDDQCFCKIISGRSPEHVRGYHGGRERPIPWDLAPEAIEEIRDAIARTARNKRRLLIAVDEAQSLSEATYRVLDGMTVGSNVYVYFQANPYLGIDDDHSFVRSHREGSHFRRIKIACVSDEEVVRRGGRPDPLSADLVFDRVPRELVTEEWIERQFRLYGLDDSFILSDVLGRFTSGTTENLVLPRTVFEQALTFDWPVKRTGPRIGIDLGFTRDQCVAVMVMHGRVVSTLSWLPARDDKQAQVSIAARIEQLMAEWGKEIGRLYPSEWDGSPITGGRVSIDDSGLVGVCDILASDGIDVDRVSFGEREHGQWGELVADLRFKNTRAELHWCARRLLQEGWASVPRDDRYSAIWRQAGWVHFEREEGPDGPVIKIESKDDIRALHGRSTDDLDAFLLALRQTPGGRVAAGMGFGPGGGRPLPPPGALQDRPRGRRIGGRWRPGADFE